MLTNTGYVLSTKIDWLDNKSDWTGLSAVAMVESTRIIGEDSHTERRYYLTSLTDLSIVAQYIRSHWAIENSQHWVLDVTFEPPRDCRRLNFLREYDNENTKLYP